MSVRHQVTDDVLTAYATGDLPEAFNLVVASHVSLCDEARVRLETMEALGGAVLDDLSGESMSYGSFEATMRLISERPKEAIKAEVVRKSCDVLPGPLMDYVGGNLDDINWRPLGMGAKQVILKSSLEANVRLLYIPSGAAMPDHGHTGIEMTLVLQGAFIDGDERFARGDIEIANEELEHTPIADIGEDCICLAATNAPLKFSGLLPRIAQPFLRI
ncbi:ChrR family anti-sigma-E factor [Actibacterium sp. 188UL27-1]|uniref:ChrR family anti-sigma-E factor n=1 Tax=Actibacterium sp. 188UL27-1 TaxID=2786961 RepID=UPI0019581974|nr:ChrR family anti-sigma-E factor [Actibacterium sp. 188UL27-1]MBM7068568.1 cupin domain-containing protein [Actibacterium sp. 188UL27-1]